MSPISTVVDALGYGDSGGYVDSSPSRPGARDFVWRSLKEKCAVDGAYFRGAVPLVAFAEAESDQQVATIQRRLWNFGRVPLLIASTPDHVQALSCYVPPDPDPKAGPLLLTSRATRRI